MGTFAANHEFMNSQYEINLQHAPALTASDRAFRLKCAVKDVAAMHGLVATFMGKPFNDQGGSGFHFHFSLDRDGSNAFADGDDPDGVSEEFRHFTAGVMAHAQALTAFLNPTINAYRRLVPDSLAPTHANWGWDNRTAFVRVPPERGGATRVEVRVGDGSANPYLAEAAILFAGPARRAREAAARPARRRRRLHPGRRGRRRASCRPPSATRWTRWRPTTCCATRWDRRSSTRSLP